MEPLVLEEPTKAQVSLRNMQRELYAYMDGRFTLRDVYWHIQNKVCPLSRRVREYVLGHFDNDGNFIAG